MLKLKFFILCSLWAAFASAEGVKCRDEFVEEPLLLQTSSGLSQNNTRLKNKVQISSHRWRSFEEAKALIQSEGIRTSAEFLEWKRAGKRPDDFPSTPHRTYKKEWRGWRDFLGTERNMMSFEEAKTFIQDEGIRTYRQFHAWKREGKRPATFPANPHQAYKEEWTGWRDFLGIGEKWMSFEEAQAFIQSEGIRTSAEFEAWKREGKRPKKFPSAPDKVYKNKWKSWMHFFGTAIKWMSFEKAKTYIQSLNIPSEKKFRAWVKSEKKPKNFPLHPNITYREEWISWGDFLGTGNIAYEKKEFMSFEEAKTFIQSEGIKTNAEFQEWKREGKRPAAFPSTPDKVYEEWVSWGDFLGTENISTRQREFMSFEEAKVFIRSEGIRTYIQFIKWKQAGKRPERFPTAPNRTYKTEWISWRDFLGTEWMSFEAAQTFIRQQGIKTETEFKAWRRAGKRPDNFPSTPYRTYKKEWRGWKDFLGTERKWVSFEAAKVFVQRLGFRSRKQFQEWVQSGQKPDRFPSTPDRAYRQEWVSWGDFLGTGNTFSYMKYKNAKKYVQTLGFEQPKDFIEWLRSSDRPIHFPPNPHQFYSEWISVKDFLSTEIYISYKEAKTFAQSLEITNSRDFLELMRDEPDIFPEDFPPNPKVFYDKTGDWIDWNDFLGLTNQIYNKINEYRVSGNEEDFQIEESEPGEEDIFTDAEEGSEWEEDVKI